VASYALEFLRTAAVLDTVYVSVGMGSGICGLIAARDLLGLRTEIVGVGAINAPATARSFAAGRSVSTESALTFADGIATREPSDEAVAIICRGAAPLAALLQERASLVNRNAGVVLSGGNIERTRLLQVLGGGTPTAG
jgi:threonine dehydratase